MSSEEKKPLEKVCIICAKGSLEDVYATLVMANGAVMEGIETNVFSSPSSALMVSPKKE